MPSKEPELKYGNERYNNHFRNMVLSAVCCGLYHPIEMVENYGRGIGEKYEHLQEIDKFCYFAIKEFYSVCHCMEVEDVTIAMCNEWTKKYWEKNQKQD